MTQEKTSEGALQFYTTPYIDGSFLPPADKTFAVINPATDAVLAEVCDAGAEETDAAVSSARAAFESGVWSGLNADGRKAVLFRLADLIAEHGEELARLDSLSMGKTLNDARNVDIPGSAYILRWYAEAIDKVFDRVAPTGNDALAVITREPLGVVGAVVPWNYPLEMAIWKLAPALAAGNSVILKPAEQSPFSALLLAKLATEAGLPDGVLNVLPGLGESAGRLLGLHPDVDCLTFTGSTAVGKLFLTYAAQSNLKQVWLECGGKSPAVIFNGCRHLDAAVKKSLFAVFFNQGEVCSANTRLYVQADIFDTVLPMLAAEAANWQPGLPEAESSRAGAIISRQHGRWVEEQIQAACTRGARIVTGGKLFSIDGKGSFFEPTILAGLAHDDPLNHTELFAPVLTVMPFDTEEQAVACANDSVYGLAASVWTDDIHQAHRVAKKIRAGTVSVNTADALGVTTPFGGCRQSGFGKDLSLLAIDKFVHVKTTWFQQL